jgi:hypothetical protein
MKLLFVRFITVNRTLKELRLLVICALLNSGFLRYDELSNIKANNISFHEEYVDIFIEKSKTDCYRNGKNVLITKLNTSQSPVTILQSYIREAKIDLSTDKYIFRPLTYFKRNKNYMMRNSNIKLSREIISKALSLHTSSIVIDRYSNFGNTYLSKEFARILGQGQIVTSLEHLAQCRGVQVTSLCGLGLTHVRLF